MAIKIQGNTKIQGKSIFAASSPTPTYTVTSNAVNSANEGTVITFTLNTTNVGNGTVLPYTITGITQQDLSSGSLTGNFTVNNNTATASITLANDALTEGAETATLTLDSVDASVAVTVNDTSLTPFSPEQIAGLKGWYDYTYGVYRTNGNDTTDDQYALVSFSAVLGLGAYGTVTINPNHNLINGKKNYGSNGGNYLRWENNLWTLTYESGRDEEFGSTYNTITAAGDTQYPWQANWTGTSNNVTRVATTNSILATNNETVAKWANKVGNLGNIYGGNMIQATLASQPYLRTSGVELNGKRLSALFGVAPTAQRTYYVVGNGASYGTTNDIILASSSTALPSGYRNALISRNVSGSRRYGLSQGTAVSSSFSPTNDSTSQIICASFESAGSGKIRVNNANEETLTGIGTNFSSASLSLFLGGTSASYVVAKEILFFEGAHTTEQKNQVINYLNAKYNLF